MTRFEFLSVFISIVLAFGVSDILSSWGEQIRLRREIQHYPLHVAWTVLLLLLMIQTWWAVWRLREVAEWTYLDYLIHVTPFLLLSLIAYVITPSFVDGNRNVKQHYYDNVPWIFSLAAAFVVMAIIHTRNILGTPFLDQTNIVRATAFFLMVTLATTRNERLHVAAAVLSYVLLGAWVGVTMFEI